MKYFYRIIFMPVVIMALISINIVFITMLFTTGKVINVEEDRALLELIDRAVMPLIRLME